MQEPLRLVLESFAGFDHEQERMIFDKAKSKLFKKNEFLLMPGNVCKNIYFVNKGCLRFFGVTEEGAEMTRYFGFKNKFATDLTSFIQNTPSLEYIQAVVDTEVLVFTRKDFYELEENTSLFKNIYKNTLEQAYITSQERIYSFQGKTAKERLFHLVKQEPDILSKIPHKLIASYLGITPFTFSRLIKQELIS